MSPEFGSAAERPDYRRRPPAAPPEEGRASRDRNALAPGKLCSVKLIRIGSGPGQDHGPASESVRSPCSVDAGGRPDGDAIAGQGPVFAYEWLTASRRWQSYALRSLLVLLLLLGLSGVWLERHDGAGELTIRKQAEIGRRFYAVTTMILLGLVGLAAPAATAGAICLDKARGNLTLLFSTDLTDAEIVLGKLAARLVPVLGLIACAAPVLALATLFGGVDPVLADRCDPGLPGLRRLRLLRWR